MPRVAHITSVHNSNDPRIVYKEVASAIRAGFEVSLLAPGEPPSSEQIARKVDFYPLRLSGRYRRILSQPEISRVAKSIGADVYHLHDPELIPLGYYLKKVTEAAVIYDMHEDYRWHGPVEGRLIRLLERWAFKWLDAIVLASPSQLQIEGVSDCLHSVVQNLPVSKSPAHPRPHPTGKFRLLYSGVVSESRGLMNMLRLARRLEKKEHAWKLQIVGICFIGNERQEAEQYIASNNLDEFVDLVGWSTYVPPDTIESYQQQSHVGLCLMDRHPRLEGVIPTKFYEYVAAGLPILCSDIPAWKSFVETHRCGIAIDPKDDRAIADALARMASQPEWYEELSSGASRSAGSFRWNTAEESLLSLYRSLLPTTV